MELAGPWEATIADDESRRAWLDHDDAAHWTKVDVPGHWRSNPAFADTDGPLLYRTRFDHPTPEAGERWWLRFDGAFYQGDVWLDGAYVGDTEGYFFPHCFEVTEALGARPDHLLGVELTCHPETNPAVRRNITGSIGGSVGIDTQWNPGGLWRPVHLERTGPVQIRHLRVLCRDANANRATVAFRAVLDSSVSGEVILRSSVGDVDHVDQRRLAAGENQVEWQIGVEDPDLWWPHALGDQPLHDVVVEVAAHPDPDGGQPPEEAPVSHRVTRRIGLRQVSMRGWVLHVNGERMFLKGANQGPAPVALADATAGDLRRIVELTREANLDLLRLHSHVTRPELYDAADELGVLVWQDFPLHRTYSRNIRKQAQRQAREMVDLLGHHPSIAVWCAHDAPVPPETPPSSPPSSTSTSTSTDQDHTPAPARGRARARALLSQELPSWNKSVLDRSVKRTIDKADGTRPVIARSGVLPHPPLFDGTDSHLWFGWHHGDDRELSSLARLMPRMVRFVSEFGAQSVPDTAQFCQPERWPDLDWEALGRHHGLQHDQLDARVPAADHPSFDSWRAATQTYQANLVRHQIETLRRLKYRPTGGFAVFSLADGQPAIGFSLVDHRGRPKPAYQALAAACQPVIVTADRLPAEVMVGETLAIDVHVVSDLRTPMQDIEVAARLSWEGGDQRWRFGGHLDADTCVRVGTLSIEVPDAPGPMILTLELTGADLPVGPVLRSDASHIVRP